MPFSNNFPWLMPPFSPFIHILLKYEFLVSSLEMIPSSFPLFKLDHLWLKCQNYIVLRVLSYSNHIFFEKSHVIESWPSKLILLHVEVQVEQFQPSSSLAILNWSEAISFVILNWNKTKRKTRHTWYTKQYKSKN